MRTSVVRSRRRPPVATMADRKSATATPTAIAGPAATEGSAMVTERRRLGAVSATEDTPRQRGQDRQGAAPAPGMRHGGRQGGHAEQRQHDDQARGEVGAGRARGETRGAGSDRAVSHLDRIVALDLRVLDRLGVSRAGRREQRAGALGATTAAGATTTDASASAATTAGLGGQRARQDVTAVRVLVDVRRDVVAGIADLPGGVVARQAAVLALLEDLLARAGERR